MTADSDLSAESAGVLGVLGDFHLLHLLTERGTITVGRMVSMAVRNMIDTISADAVEKSDCASDRREVLVGANCRLWLDQNNRGAGQASNAISSRHLSTVKPRIKLTQGSTAFDRPLQFFPNPMANISYSRLISWHGKDVSKISVSCDLPSTVLAAVEGVSIAMINVNRVDIVRT